MDFSVTPYFQTILKYSVTLSKNHEKKSDLRTIYYIRSDLKRDFLADAGNESPSSGLRRSAGQIWDFIVCQ